MDPDAALARIRDLAAAVVDDGWDGVDPGDAIELATRVVELDEWLTRSGFPPTDWVGPIAPAAPHTTRTQRREGP